MTRTVDYSPAERRWLWLAAATGFFGLNAVFIYGLVRPVMLLWPGRPRRPPDTEGETP